MTEYKPQISVDSLVHELKHIRLPEALPCPHCNVDVKLAGTERASFNFDCPQCGASDDIAIKIDNIRGKISEQTDEELMQVLLAQEDYLIETVIAAKQEIVKRGLDIKNIIDMDSAEESIVQKSVKANQSLSWFMRILMFLWAFGLYLSLITGLAIILSSVIGQAGIVTSPLIFFMALTQIIFVEYLRNTGYRKKYMESWRWIIYGVGFYFGISVLGIIFELLKLYF